MAESLTAARLTRVLQAAAVPVVSVSIGTEASRATWKVQPAPLQAAAQPLIDSFNPLDPALETAELDADVKAIVDDERLISAVVWTVIDQLAAPATIAKYAAARTKIIAVYKSQPWKP
jgi:hypothetical protein